MAGTSIYGIAERVGLITGRMGDIQAITQLVIDAYSSSVKQEYYENRQDGCQEVDGAFLFTFGETTPLVPTLNSFNGQYYITLPSSYLRLPNEMGIAWVSYPKDRQPFVRVNALWNDSLKASGLGGSQVYQTEGDKIYFPKMTSNDVGNILLKMALAMDDIDVDQELSIPRSVVDGIVSAVVNKLTNKPDGETKAKE